MTLSYGSLLPLPLSLHTHTLDLFPSPSSSCIRSSLYLFVQFPTEVLRYSGPSLLLNAQCEIRFVPCACPVKRYALFAEGKTRSSSCLSVVSAPGTHRGPCVSRLEDARASSSKKGPWRGTTFFSETNGTLQSRNNVFSFWQRFPWETVAPIKLEEIYHPFFFCWFGTGFWVGGTPHDQ